MRSSVWNSITTLAIFLRLNPRISEGLIELDDFRALQVRPLDLLTVSPCSV